MASKSNIDYFEKCLKMSNANRDPLGIANYHVGDAYFSSGKYETAIKYYEKSLEIYIQIGLGKNRKQFKISHYPL